MFEKLRFKFWDGAEQISGHIRDWSPESYKAEQQFEKSLFTFLSEKYEDIQITKQYARGRIRADIVVDGKIIIELKNNLNSTSKLHRLIGQIGSYKTWSGPIFVVLCGDTEKNLLNELKSYVQRENLSDENSETYVKIFVK